MNIESFVSLIPGARRSGGGWIARCPAHEDRRASFSIAQGQSGRILVKCFAGCSVDAVLDSLGLRRSDLFEGECAGTFRQKGPLRAVREAPKAKPKMQFATLDAALQDIVQFRGAYSASWKYQDASGAVVGVVLRWDGPNGKDLRPASLINGHWEMAAMPKPRPLYNLPNVLREPRVLVVEGEKAAAAGNDLGFCVTTSSNGSQSASQTDWTPLLGKQVIILPDNDDPGKAYAREVNKLLRGRAHVLELPGLPEGGDLADWVKSNKFAKGRLKKMLVQLYYKS